MKYKDIEILKELIETTRVLLINRMNNLDFNLIINGKTLQFEIIPTKYQEEFYDKTLSLIALKKLNGFIILEYDHKEREAYVDTYLIEDIYKVYSIFEESILKMYDDYVNLPTF